MLAVLARFSGDHHGYLRRALLRVRDGEGCNHSEFPTNSYLFVQSADTAKFVEAPAQYAAVDEIFCRYLSLVLADEMDAQSAMMDAAKAKIDSALAN